MGINASHSDVDTYKNDVIVTFCADHQVPWFVNEHGATAVDSEQCDAYFSNEREIEKREKEKEKNVDLVCVSLGRLERCGLPARRKDL